MKRCPAAVTVTLPAETIAKLWLSDNILAAIHELELKELLDCYRLHGKRELVYWPEENRYLLRDKKGAE